MSCFVGFQSEEVLVINLVVFEFKIHIRKFNCDTIVLLSSNIFALNLIE